MHLDGLWQTYQKDKSSKVIHCEYLDKCRVLLCSQCQVIRSCSALDSINSRKFEIAKAQELNIAIENNLKHFGKLVLI